MNILVSSAGRRGALIQLAQSTVQRDSGQVFAVDAAPWSSACRLADGWQVVPRFDDEAFFDAIASICRRHRIEVIVPTHDKELPVYARLSPLFAELGIRVACSGPQTVAIASDKRLTDQFLTQHGLPAAKSIQVDDPQFVPPHLFPVVVKPSSGSGSKGVQICNDTEELAFFYKRTEHPVVQQLARGREFTTNFFVSRGECIAAVPHWRVETRGGEVSKCMTVRKDVLIDLAAELAKSLPDASGPLCFQAFIDEENQARIIEINARFGGGYPIAHHAGANFIQLLIDQTRGMPLVKPQWSDGLAMTRWDDAVFWNTRESLRCA